MNIKRKVIDWLTPKEPRHVLLNGTIYERDTQQYDYNVYCHDCGIRNLPGNVHKFNCDMEKCPRCGGQLFICTCDYQGLCD